LSFLAIGLIRPPAIVNVAAPVEQDAASKQFRKTDAKSSTLVPNRSSAFFVSHNDTLMSPLSEATPGKRECNTAEHGHWNERPSSVPAVEKAGQQG
jgi:hypothetical protein